MLGEVELNTVSLNRLSQTYPITPHTYPSILTLSTFHSHTLPATFLNSRREVTVNEAERQTSKVERDTYSSFVSQGIPNPCSDLRVLDVSDLVGVLRLHQDKASDPPQRLGGYLFVLNGVKSL